MEAEKEDVEAYLAKIRKTVADSEAVMEQARLRMAETDRLLAAQGVTREQVLGMKFTREQHLAVNERLKMMGLPPVEDEAAAYDFDAAAEAVRAGTLETAPEEGGSLEQRQRKFDHFMQTYRL